MAVVDSWLARFVFDRKKIRADDTVKHKAFLPATQHGNNTSVFAVGDLSNPDVCQLARDEIEPSEGRAAKGYAKLEPADVLHAGLVVEIDEPPPRHRVISGWSDRREKQDEAALILAARCSFVRCSVP